MKRHSFASSVALGVLTLLVLATPVAAKATVPFKGRLDGVVTITPLDPLGLLPEQVGDSRAISE